MLWSFRLKCEITLSILVFIFMSDLQPLFLCLNVVMDDPIDCNWHFKHSIIYITFESLQVTLLLIWKSSCLWWNLKVSVRDRECLQAMQLLHGYQPGAEFFSKGHNLALHNKFSKFLPFWKAILKPFEYALLHSESWNSSRPN